MGHPRHATGGGCALRSGDQSDRSRSGVQRRDGGGGREGPAGARSSTVVPRIRLQRWSGVAPCSGRGRGRRPSGPGRRIRRITVAGRRCCGARRRSRLAGRQGASSRRAPRRGIQRTRAVLHRRARVGAARCGRTGEGRRRARGLCRRGRLQFRGHRQRTRVGGADRRGSQQIRGVAAVRAFRRCSAMAAVARIRLVGSGFSDVGSCTAAGPHRAAHEGAAAPADPRCVVSGVVRAGRSVGVVLPDNGGRTMRGGRAGSGRGIAGVGGQHGRVRSHRGVRSRALSTGRGVTRGRAFDGAP